MTTDGNDSRAVEILENAVKTYSYKGLEYTALRGINLTIERGKFYSIMGPSGSGKSTLLHILGLLDTPTSGRVVYKSVEAGRMKDRDLSAVRGREIGFVFQSYNLIPRMTAMKNMLMAMSFGNKIPQQDRKERGQSLLSTVGMGDKSEKLVSQLSGGEQQRVAIARAMANDPSLIVADEPTGNLDSENARIIMDLFTGVRGEERTIIVATHNPDVAKYADINITIRDGKLAEES